MRKCFISVLIICLVSTFNSFGQIAKPSGSGASQGKKLQGQKTSKQKPPTAKLPSVTKTITIGDQIWAAANLNATRFRNGDTIPQAKTAEEWKKAGAEGKPAWCNYNNDPANGAKYGKLYNWFAVNDIRGLAPEGFSIPSEADWEKLKVCIGGVFNGGKLKSTGLTLWKKENEGATNVTGFSAIPAGSRYHFGEFHGLGASCHFWSSTMLKGVNDAYYCDLSGNSGNYGFGYTSPQNGFSVRLIKKENKTVQIGTQHWMSENLNTFHFRNGDPIPQTKTPQEWLLAGLRKQPAFLLETYKTPSGEHPMVYYNWYAVNDKRNLAPEGFHIPSDPEWNALLWELGGEMDAGKELETGQFAGEPAGIRFESGQASMAGSEGQWWSASETDSASAGALYAPYRIGKMAKVMQSPKGMGIPVRCISDKSVLNPGPEYGEVKDLNGVSRKTVKIGEQTWMAENLWATTYQDGTKIPFVGYGLSEHKTPAYTDYTRYIKSAQSKISPYGRYYNGYVPLMGNPCPPGWHIPTKTDIEALIAFLGKNNIAKNLKSRESAYWEFGPGNNRYGFNALGAGYFNPKDLPLGQRNNATWWSSTEKDENSVWTMSIGINDLYLSSSEKSYGYPCRCIKD